MVPRLRSFNCADYWRSFIVVLTCCRSAVTYLIVSLFKCRGTCYRALSVLDRKMRKTTGSAGNMISTITINYITGFFFFFRYCRCFEKQHVDTHANSFQDWFKRYEEKVKVRVGVFEFLMRLRKLASTLVTGTHCDQTWKYNFIQNVWVLLHRVLHVVNGATSVWKHEHWNSWCSLKKVFWSLG